MADDNVELGRFDLVGLPAAQRGIPQIEVAFDIDANGIVHVSAKDLGTGKEQSIRITAPKKLSKEEIEKMVKDADKFAADDAKKKKRLRLRIKRTPWCIPRKKSLKEFGDKVSGEEKENIQKKLDELKEALKGKDTARTKKATEELNSASHKLAEEIYKQSAAKQQKTEENKQGPEDKKSEGQAKDKNKKTMILSTRNTRPKTITNSFQLSAFGFQLKTLN